VHNQSTTSLILDGGIFVSPGVDTYIGVSRTFMSKDQSLHSNCVKDLKPFSEYSKTIFDYFHDLNVTSYDQRLCIDLCYQDKLIDMCKCSTVNVPTLKDVEYCDVHYGNGNECENQFKVQFESSSTETFCENVCKPLCDTESFEVSNSFVYYPHYKLNERINSTMYLPKSLNFRVNYKTLTYTIVHEKPAMTTEMLLGYIGGQLGLFLGISFLSLVELLEIFFEFLILFKSFLFELAFK
jgi:hypothetical protein